MTLSLASVGRPACGNESTNVPRRNLQAIWASFRIVCPEAGAAETKSRVCHRRPLPPSPTHLWGWTWSAHHALLRGIVPGGRGHERRVSESQRARRQPHAAAAVDLHGLHVVVRDQPLGRAQCVAAEVCLGGNLGVSPRMGPQMASPGSPQSGVMAGRNYVSAHGLEMDASWCRTFDRNGLRWDHVGRNLPDSACVPKVPGYRFGTMIDHRPVLLLTRGGADKTVL